MEHTVATQIVDNRRKVSVIIDNDGRCTCANEIKKYISQPTKKEYVNIFMRGKNGKTRGAGIPILL
jgi:hypothetical protein